MRFLWRAASLPDYSIINKETEMRKRLIGIAACVLLAGLSIPVMSAAPEPEDAAVLMPDAVTESPSMMKAPEGSDSAPESAENEDAGKSCSPDAGADHAGEPRSKSPQEPSVTAARQEMPARTGMNDGTPETVSFVSSFGIFHPVSRYAERYGSAALYSLGVSFLSLSFREFYPSFGVSYADLRTKEDPEYVSSRMKLSTATLGIGRAFEFESPSILKEHTFLSRGFHAEAGAYCGATHVSFTSDIERSPVTDNVGTLGVSAGLFARLTERLDGGAEFRAQRIFTSGVPLDSVGVSLCVSGRW